MMHLPQYFYDLNWFSITLRLFLAVLFGGIIGLERGANRHPAGFRTHILVCIGAAIAMLTNQYICGIWGSTSDPARLGAQVITGVGFLGVGTILITGRNRIKGLTTAAGLWASACLGLAIGIGFYEGAVIGAVLIFVSLAFLPKMENFFYEHSGVVNVYVEVKDVTYYHIFKEEIIKLGAEVTDTSFDKSKPLTPGGACFTCSVKYPKHIKSDEIVEMVSKIDGVTLADEL